MDVTIFQCLGNYLLFLLTSRSLRPSLGLDFDILLDPAMQNAVSIKNDASLDICIRFSIKFLPVRLSFIYHNSFIIL